jgi:hypothetical protein
VSKKFKFKDAVTCLHESYDEIKKALESLIMDRSQTKETQNDAQNLTKKMNSFEIVFLTILWKDILCHFNETSKTLQKENLNLDVAVRILKSLLHFIKDLRSQFQEYEEKAKMMLPNTEYEDASKRAKKEADVWPSLMMKLKKWNLREVLNSGLRHTFQL